MRRSRLLLLTLLPGYGLMTLSLTYSTPFLVNALQMLGYSMPGEVPYGSANTAIAMSNLPAFVVHLVVFTAGLEITIFAWVAVNLAFWLPVAHLIDNVLEKRRRRAARAGGP